MTAPLSRLDPNRPTVPEVLPEVQAFMRKNPAGCCLHVVLDDHNVEDDCVAHALECAVARGHPECEGLARRLLPMSRTQRAKLSDRCYDEATQ